MPFTWAYEPALFSSYRPVTEIALKQDLPINFHWAAPLSQMMSWRHPEVIRLIKEGISTGKFEIMGSAYAQNVMEATSDWSNQEQITYNRQVLEDIYDEYPRGFWNPERVWNDRFAKLLVKNGYTHTLIERRILNPESPEEANKLYAQRVEGTTLNFLPDDQSVLSAFDTAIWTGDTSKFIALMNRYADEGREMAVYAQDTEVIGFWQIAHKRNPKIFQKNFQLLLDTIRDNSWIEVQKLSEISSGEPTMVDKLNRGQASWMEDSVKKDGYIDYFTYLAESPEIEYYQNLYRDVEKKLREGTDTEVQKVAKQIYLKSQFEFGCAPGSMGGDNTRYLLNVPGQMTWESLRYADRLLSYNPSEYQMKWMNFQGHPLALWQNKYQRILVSPYGGRIIELINNNRIISPSPYFYNRSGNLRQLDHPSPRFKFPEYSSTMVHGGTLFEDSLEIDNMKQGELSHVETIYGNEQIKVQEKSLSHSYYNTQILPLAPEVKMWRREGDITLIKRVFLTDKVEVSYRLTSRTTHTIKFEVSSEVSPSPLRVIDSGDVQIQGNVLKNGDVTCTFDFGEAEISYERAMFAQRIIGTIEGEVTSKSPIEFSISLEVSK